MKKCLVAVLIMVVVMMAGCGNSNSVEESAGADSQMTENEPDELSTIEGTVLEINETNILINESSYENGECYLIISDDTVIYVDGEKSNISMIEVGQSIKAVYTGGIEEIYPSMINEVIEIIAEQPSGTERNLVAGENTITIDGVTMEVTEHSVADTSETTRPDISVASAWDREVTVSLSAEDAAVIVDLLSSGNWMEGTGDCLDDCIIFMDSGKILYDSSCGTFNDTVNEKRLHLTEEQQAAVNAILEKYIALGVGDVPVTEEKYAQSAESSGIPKDGTIQDGKIYFEGFGWVDYEGGGTEGTYAEDIYENGNTIGTMD